MEAAGVGAGKEEKRRRKKPWAKIEVTGGGGILILGGVLIAAAVGAGTAFVARRAQRRRSSTTAKPADDEENDSASKPLTSKNPDVGGTEDTILEDDSHNDGCGSVEQTLEESEFVLVNGTGEESEQILEKPDLVGELISSTEPQLDVSQQPTEQPLHESEITFTFAHEEEDDDGVSSMESKYGMNCQQVEFAHDDEEKEDGASLKEGAQFIMTELDEASTDSQFDQVNREDEPDFVLAEKIRREVEVLLAESRIEMTEFSAVKEIDEQEEEEEASSTAIIEETKPQLEMSQQQTEQAMDEPKIVLVHEEIEDRKAMSSESESESGMNDHQTDLAYDNEAKEENESGIHQTQPGINECCSDDVRGESMLQQIYKRSELSTMDINEMEEVSSTGSQDIAGSSAEEAEEAEMREEGSDSTGVSSTESNADAIWPAEVIEQEKTLQAMEVVADTGDQLETSAETKNMIHVEAAEEEQQKEIILVKQVTVDNVMATELTTDKEKLPLMDWFSMNSPTRLFLLVVVMALILGFLSFIDHFIKLSYRLYQILSPSSENRREL
ncbi:unnamed protein product [Musa textilis]